ncbi:MAG TPA: hypothetical protein VHU40_12215, partial [Polyangia bacterium]|nr:hypothetical protein [Polyangia bacterium]
MTVPNKPPRRRRLGVPAAIVGGSALVIALGALLAARADSRTNRVPLTAAPKGVTVVAARAAQFRPYRHYIGTVEP